MSTRTGERTRELLAEQRRRLVERVEGSGLYRHEVDEFAVATAAHERLVDRLGIAGDLGSLTSPESRNVVRRVVRADGTAAVLKVVGNAREPGEGAVLQAWRRAGLPCAEPLEWGYERVPQRGRTRVATWLLNRYVPGTVLGDDPGTDGLADRAQRLVRFVSPFHDSRADVPVARSWADRLAPHLREVLPLIRAAGLREPAGWQERLQGLSDRGRVLVHGDPAGINVVVDPAGRWWFIDPPGAVVAMREADAGQIAWHTGGVAALEAAVEAVCDADRTLQPDAVAAFAGLNLVVAAGYELARHTREPLPDPSPTGQTRTEDPARAQHLLDRAHGLLAWG